MPAKIIKKIVFHIPIETKTPLRIASGFDDGLTDILILKTKDDKPFIPATSLGGVLRSEIQDIYGEQSNVEQIVFGNINDIDGNQSLINISDIMLTNAQTVYRDGIKIDPLTNVTQKGAKYDFEALDRGATGNLIMEITVRECNLNDKRLADFTFKHDEFRQTSDIFGDIAATIADIFTQGINIGSLTTKGYGKIQSTSPVSFYSYDFTKPENAIAWLNYLDGKMPTKSDYTSKQTVIAVGENDLNLIIDFSLKSSLIIRDYDVNTNEDDITITAVQMKSNNDFVIPGSSIKGVLRNRAYHILMCLTDNDEYRTNAFLDEFMGFANDTKAKKSNLFVNEIYIPNKDKQFHAQIQTRNRIDRFTGGTIDNALFTEEPIWQMDKQLSPIKLMLTIKNCTKAQAGLILLLLKDLWLGNLTIGGGKAIGRGVLQGRNCQLTAPKLLNNKIFKIEETTQFNTIGNTQDLENLVQALVGELSE